MAATHELRLQSMLRSMNEVIIPAIDKKAQLAVDQANILVGNLRILLDQHDKEYQFRVTELRQYVELVKGLVAVAKGGADTDASRNEAATLLARAGPVAELPIPTQVELTEQVRALRAAADALTKAAYADGDPAFRKAAGDLVLNAGGEEILRERVWVRKANFEAEPDALPAIEDLLARG